MIKSYLYLIILLISIPGFSQNSRLAGRIIDAKSGEPLSDAKISINSLAAGSSGKNGYFDVRCKRGMELEVSFVGYTSWNATIEDCSKTLNIALIPSVAELGEVQLKTALHVQRALENPVSEVQLNPVELNRGTGLYLDDAINANVPGVSMNRRAVSSGQQFNIRGYGNGVGFRGATNNFDGQGYKVYLNNIPVTDAEGVTLLDDIDFASIGSVDVIKGPAGTKFGLAIAGVVQLQTQRPEAGEISLGQELTVGDYGLLRSTTKFATATENTSLLLNYGHQTSDGYMAHTASDKDFVNAVVDFRPNENQYLSAYFGYSNSYDQRGGELTIEQYNNLDYSGSARYIKNNAHSEVISFRAGLSHSYLFNNWLSNTTSVFGSGVNSNASSAGGWTDKTPVNYGTRSVFDFSFNLNNDFALNGSAGFELQEQRAQIVGYGMVENPEDPEGYNIIGGLRSNQFAVSNNSNIFTEWTLQMPRDFSLTAGVGMSSMNIDLENRMYEADSDMERNVNADYHNLVSPHFALNKIFNDNVSVYASYSRGYNAPVSGNIVLSTSGELNTGLEPEVGDQLEIGSKGSLFSNRLYYEAAVFNAFFKNKFTSVAVPLDENTTSYTYIANGGKLDNKGIELLLKFNAYESSAGFFRSIRPYGNFTYSDFEYEDYAYESLNSEGEAVQVDYSGNAVAGVAPWVVNAGVDLQSNAGFYGNINYSYRDTVPFTSDGANVTDPYNLLNAKLGYRQNFGHFEADVYVGARNITGSQYYYMVFLNQLPDAYLPAPYEANYFGGIRLKYNF
ncbi:TonB-dependent receptor [Autumnicola musiva]|uniref:TonB-dependent receptor n=1 Tax=Autumnicola musiva TaxID=3075589 RepID=A0ABU3D902_9FLAO|nr:TonB-dependent receptor [Zunongwangia sp. F117]MDT0678008.1 TonB-dependent receptor [Zunongwangia sp. F117]